MYGRDTVHHATRGSDELVPPSVSGTYSGHVTTTTTSAGSLDLGVSGAGAWYTFQARGGDVYVRFGASSTTETTSGDGSNGYKIPNGEERNFWISPESRYVDHICSATSKKLFWWQSSPSYGDP